MEDGAQLMMRVRARDTGAFERLYDAYHRLVYGVAMRVLGDRTGAEDVTQTVFLKLWSSPDSFQSGNFAGWLVRVSRNRALDVLRTKSRIAPQASDPLPIPDTPEQEVFAALDATRVRAALAQLPSEQRQPIELGFFGGLTHEEIARSTGAPLGTIKTRIRSGLRRLRSELDGTVRV